MLPFMRNIFSSSFLIIPFFVENYNANLFLVNFDKELSFLIIPKFLFLFILFLFIPNVPRWLPVTPLVLAYVVKKKLLIFKYYYKILIFLKKNFNGKTPQLCLLNVETPKLKIYR